MPLNVSETENTSGQEPRDRLVEELVEELTSWRPREFLASLRRLHRGAISLVHLNVLALLAGDAPLSMGHLADALDVSIASLTGIVSRMEARGLVERVHSERDRRVVLVRLTDAGRELVAGMNDRRRAALVRIAAELTDDQLHGLIDGHRALRAARLRVFPEHAGHVGVRRADNEDPQPTEDDASR